MRRKQNDLDFMTQALQLASQRRGFCAPNPSVGAVVVKEGIIIGTGFHWACGHPHAEVGALHEAGKAAEGATLYVTLEPCCHHGRTPPCTDLIIRNKISQVVYSTLDPNPIVAGKGVAKLEQAGINCRYLEHPSIKEFYYSYTYWQNKNHPWVTAKLALSIDNKIAGVNGQPEVITGKDCQRFTHQQRLKSDAILTTCNTILADDPQLNVRLDQEIYAKPLYLLDSELRIPLNAKIFQTTQSLTVFHCHEASPSKQLQLKNLGVNCQAVNRNIWGLNLHEVLTFIGKEGRHDLWVEAGVRCFESFLTQRLLQRVFIYISPKVLGPTATSGFSQAFNLLENNATISWISQGPDVIAQIDYAS